jgi:YD repeat-containing protein
MCQTIKKTADGSDLDLGGRVWDWVYTLNKKISLQKGKRNMIPKRLSLVLALVVMVGLALPCFADTIIYQYDNLYRLRTATYADGTVIEYTYDFAGNRLTKVISAAGVVILHRDGALWSSSAGWTLTAPPYYQGTDYARALQVRTDNSYVILHKDGAIYDSASGWITTAPPYYPGLNWAVDLELK